MSEALQWLALALLGVAMAAAFGAIIARSLFVTCMHLVTVGTSVAAVVLMLGAGEGALALALIAAAWAPVLLLAAMLLSVRATKQVHAGQVLLGWLAAAVVLGLAWWPLGQLGPAPEIISARPVGLGFWLAPLVLVAAAACLGLLGYGERGAMTRGHTP
ncbi:MAG: hypothetical protein ACT4OF_10735 [Caulobacteraceae bacterium]